MSNDIVKKSDRLTPNLPDEVPPMIARPTTEQAGSIDVKSNDFYDADIGSDAWIKEQGGSAAPAPDSYDKQTGAVENKSMERTPTKEEQPKKQYEGWSLIPTGDPKAQTFPGGDDEKKEDKSVKALKSKTEAGYMVYGLHPNAYEPFMSTDDENFSEIGNVVKMGKAHSLVVDLYPALPKFYNSEGDRGLQLFNLDLAKGKEVWHSIIKPLEKYITYHKPPSPLRLAVQNDMSIAEQWDHSFGETNFESMANVGSPTIQELKSVTGTYSVTELLDKALENNEYAQSLKNMAGPGIELAGAMKDAALSYAGISPSLAKTFMQLIEGSKVDFPTIWRGSSYSPQYQLTCRLYNPVPTNPYAYKRFILTPLAYILAFACPTSDSKYTYTYPLMVKARCPGLFYIPAGFISSVQLIKGGDTMDITFQQQPGMVDIRFTIESLYGTMVASRELEEKDENGEEVKNYITGSEEMEKDGDRLTLKKYIANMWDWFDFDPIGTEKKKEEDQKKKEVPPLVSSLENMGSMLDKVLSRVSNLPNSIAKTLAAGLGELGLGGGILDSMGLSKVAGLVGGTLSSVTGMMNMVDGHILNGLFGTLDLVNMVRDPLSSLGVDIFVKDINELNPFKGVKDQINGYKSILGSIKGDKFKAGVTDMTRGFEIPKWFGLGPIINTLNQGANDIFGFVGNITNVIDFASATLDNVTNEANEVLGIINGFSTIGSVSVGSVTQSVERLKDSFSRIIDVKNNAITSVSTCGLNLLSTVDALRDLGMSLTECPGMVAELLGYDDFETSLMGQFMNAMADLFDPDGQVDIVDEPEDVIDYSDIASVLRNIPTRMMYTLEYMEECADEIFGEDADSSVIDYSTMSIDQIREILMRDEVPENSSLDVDMIEEDNLRSEIESLDLDIATDFQDSLSALSDIIQNKDSTQVDFENQVATCKDMCNSYIDLLNTMSGLMDKISNVMNEIQTNIINDEMLDNIDQEMDNYRDKVKNGTADKNGIDTPVGISAMENALIKVEDFISNEVRKNYSYDN